MIKLRQKRNIATFVKQKKVTPKLVRTYQRTLDKIGRLTYIHTWIIRQLYDKILFWQNFLNVKT